MKKAPKHLIPVDGKLYATYGTYYTPQYRVWFDKYVNVVRKAIPLIEKELGSIPTGLKVIFKPIRNKNTKAQYFNLYKHIYLDIRAATERDMLMSLAHEYIHVRQYHTGKLAQTLHPNGLKQMVYCWEGRHFIKAKDFKMYYIQPWEIEARSEGNRIGEIVAKELGI